MRVSWWMWAFIAWLVLSVPFAIFTAKLIAMNKDAFDARAERGGSSSAAPDPARRPAAARQHL